MTLGPNPVTVCRTQKLKIAFILLNSSTGEQNRICDEEVTRDANFCVHTRRRSAATYRRAARRGRQRDGAAETGPPAPAETLRAGPGAPRSSAQTRDLLPRCGPPRRPEYPRRPTTASDQKPRGLCEGRAGPGLPEAARCTVPGGPHLPFPRQCRRGTLRVHTALCQACHGVDTARPPPPRNTRASSPGPAAPSPFPAPSFPAGFPPAPRPVSDPGLAGRRALTAPPAAAFPAPAPAAPDTGPRRGLLGPNGGSPGSGSSAAGPGRAPGSPASSAR